MNLAQLDLNHLALSLAAGALALCALQALLLRRAGNRIRELEHILNGIRRDLKALHDAELGMGKSLRRLRSELDTRPDESPSPSPDAISGSGQAAALFARTRGELNSEGPRPAAEARLLSLVRGRAS